ncbi:uncharacterized protein BDCG_16484 [Blastomyces dermatitidis ER-3]|uniref:Uncharacterized protein n=1 Tax=Ajellomyces dermatitidis (strain ER-3 / ATCC MYA-2586) TaxID=559297 RepID=A0ABX2VSD7_AJEDR|nr:uncharacterized protein BDCG_16484 [Blastomyces dermatitidis ER-3]OAT00129.1 hypothetical protein BDCG_16484 [Blastomyces dermatitidis ER-3]
MTDKTMSSATVHLSVPGDWKLWYKHMLGYAKDKKVSDFINLDKPDIFSELEEPLEPESPEEATAEAKIAYDIKVTAWKIKYMKYEKMNEGMTKIRDVIWRTVDATELRHVRSEDDDVKEIIHSLRDCLSPTTADYQDDVRTRYHDLCKAPKNRGIEKWLNDWSLIEDDIKEADIAGQFNLKKDFLNANLAIDAGYAQAWAKDVRRDKDVISLIELVKDFKERYREMGILKGDKPMNFATLNGRPQQSSPATFRNCICGARHRYTQCYYLNPSRKPPGWKENGEKRTQIDQALKNQELKRHIDHAISRDSFTNTDMVDANEAVLGGMVLKQSDHQSIDHQSIDHQSIDHQSIDHQPIDHQSIDQQIRKISMNSSHSRSYL